MMLSKRLHERGAVLFVGLIMLILITLLAVSAIRLAKTNMMIAGNEQYQSEAESAANFHLDVALNTDDFTATKIDNVQYPLPAFDGASTTAGQSYTVSVPRATCKRYRYLKKSELVGVGNSVSIDNLACFGSSGGSGITIVVDAASLDDNSLCATSLWEMVADVDVASTGTTVQMAQGVEMRIDYAEATTACEKEE